MALALRGARAHQRSSAPGKTKKPKIYSERRTVSEEGSHPPGGTRPSRKARSGILKLTYRKTSVRENVRGRERKREREHERVREIVHTTFRKNERNE